MFLSTVLFTLLLRVAVNNGAEIFLEWHVALNTTLRPVSSDQPVRTYFIFNYFVFPNIYVFFFFFFKVITINGMFPGPLINASTNDDVHINVFNHMDEPLLITW